MTSSEEEWWSKPFTIRTETSSWAILTDKAFFVAIQGGYKFSPCEGPSTSQTEICRMVNLKSTGVVKVVASKLLAFVTEHQEAEVVKVLGVDVDPKKVQKVLSKTKKPDVGLWDASKHFPSGCLGFEVGPSWRGYLMGMLKVEGDPVEFPVEVPAERDLFNEVMS